MCGYKNSRWKTLKWNELQEQDVVYRPETDKWEWNANTYCSFKHTVVFS